MENKRIIDKIRLRTKMSEMKHVFSTTPYKSTKDNAKAHMSMLQEEYRSICGEYAEDLKIVENVNEDGSFHNINVTLSKFEMTDLELALNLAIKTSEEAVGMSKEKAKSDVETYKALLFKLLKK